MSDYDYDLIVHTCSIQEITRVMKKQDAEIKWLTARVKELEENIYAAGVFVEQM